MIQTDEGVINTNIEEGIITLSFMNAHCNTRVTTSLTIGYL